MAIRIIAVILLLGTFWLVGWNNGYDTGYGGAMADNFLGVKTAEQYFQELINARRGVPHRSDD